MYSNRAETIVLDPSLHKAISFHTECKSQTFTCKGKSYESCEPSIGKLMNHHSNTWSGCRNRETGYVVLNIHRRRNTNLVNKAEIGRVVAIDPMDPQKVWYELAGILITKMSPFGKWYLHDSPNKHQLEGIDWECTQPRLPYTQEEEENWAHGYLLAD